MMNMQKITTQTATTWGSITALLGAFSLNEWAMLIGIFCTVISTAASVYFNYKRMKNECMAREKENENQ